MKLIKTKLCFKNRWKAIRNKTMFDFSYQCAKCNKFIGKNGHIHHLSYNNVGKYNEINDLVYLCVKCHKTQHFGWV